jgi:serine/threonine protein kinase
VSETSPASRVGVLFGPYQLRRMLGRGGMGEVYEAYDTVKDRVVALKLMSEQFTSDDVFRERMQREAHTAGRLQEPHIVPIHDYGEIDGHLFIDMRFVHGTDVGKVLRRDGALAPPRAAAIVGQIASALDAAHANGVIHRDIKPENVLLTGEDFAYLVDFGIAAAFTDTHLTKTGTAIGTWKYMAPERFGDDEITYRVDIYALACVLYECLTGVPPYPTDNLPALMAAHLTQPVPQASHQNPAIPTALDHVIACGMAKNPADRYNSAGDLARAAHHSLSTTDQFQAATLLAHSQHHAPPLSGPIAWHQPPPWIPQPPRRDRKPWLIGAAAVAVIALVATGIFLATGSTANQRPTAAHTATTTTTIPTIAAAQLGSILLTGKELDTILDASNMQASPIESVLDPGTTVSVSPENCRGSVLPGDGHAYVDSGYTGVAVQGVSDGGSHFVDQAVVAFDSADKASALVNSSVAKWKSCARQSATESMNGSQVKSDLGDVTGSPPKIAQFVLKENANGWGCQRVLSAVRNVVLDLAACGAHITDDASRMADAMAAKATT